MTLLGVGVGVGAALGLGYLFVQWTGGLKVSAGQGLNRS
ncbi:MAG: hypothetical protein QOH52_1397 [Pseudonocardiales bacterium]|jgi:hypothetical protein|nr:hypothetical protein [Pseudonocardiales bacterium]